MPPDIFALDYFSDRVSHFFPVLALDINPPASHHVAGITGEHHHAQPDLVWLCFV
jgi:hypothetical protein